MDENAQGSNPQGQALDAGAQPTLNSGATTRADESAQRTVYPFTFTASGSEFFRIWVVNLALTILTLGIFSAWAKVRTNRYFYGNTRLDGDAFDYIAAPLAILKGRLIAVAAVGVYTLAQYLNEVLGYVLFGVLLISIPFLLVRSMRFNASVTVWRGIRMGFNGGYGEAFKTYLMWPVIGILTLGLLIPHSWYKKNQYLIGNYRFGRTLARSSTTSGDFYLIAMLLFGASLAMLLVAGTMMAALIFIADGSALLGIVSVAVYLLAYVLIYVLYQALHYRLIYEHIHVGETRLRSRIRVMGWMWIAVTNSLGILFTLGFYYPWARTRMLRYIFAHVHVESTDLSSYGADEIDHHSAAGEELGEAFDMGLGL